MCIDGVTVGVVPYFTRYDGIVGGYLFLGLRCSSSEQTGNN